MNASDTSPESEDGLGDLVDQLDGNRESMIRALRVAVDHRLSGSKLRKKSGVPPGSFYHHRERLREAGLIEMTGREIDDGGGDPSKEVRLTDRGRKVYERLASSPETPEERIQMLEDRVDELEEQNKTRRQEARALVGILEENGIDAEERFVELLEARRDG